MAWRPGQHLIDGELDNTEPYRITGWMRFAGLDHQVTFDLKGEFHRDICRAKIRIRGNGNSDDPEAARHMKHFASHQTGDAGDITAGRPPHDYVDYPYIEWHSDQNGRVVIELCPSQVEVIGTPIPLAEHLSQSLEEKAAEFVQLHPTLPNPTFTHWVWEHGRIIGEAHSLVYKGAGIFEVILRRFEDLAPPAAESLAAEQLLSKSGEPLPESHAGLT